MLCKYVGQRASRLAVICKGKVERVCLAGQQRHLHYDGRNRRSNLWAATSLIKQASSDDTTVSNQDLLVKAGFIYQAHSGIFHVLPLGLRVQEKLERLIDKHMTRLGAAKLSLSSLSSEELWQRSGRLEGRNSEFFKLTDRKKTKYLLSPTHEEEITMLVANAVSTHKDLPLRLYQISRKYRDEARPRQGLLRGREFLMKDLYTFDMTEQQAISTYEEVRKAYCAFLDELRLPYLVANADSGNMGGTLSHEYHFESPQGEDKVIQCSNCGHTVNEELYIAPYLEGNAVHEGGTVEHFYISKDRKQMYKLTMPEGCDVNLHALKKIHPEIDTGIIDALGLWNWNYENKHVSPDSFITISDPRCKTDNPAQYNEKPILLSAPSTDDACSECQQKSLKISNAIEIGHTFHLSTRYSAVFDAAPLDLQGKRLPLHMGCHGIGVSRLIAAVSGLLADESGLNWPLAVAPFQVVMLAVSAVDAGEVENAYDELLRAVKTTMPDMDIVIDDRARPPGWKLNDADLIGYPFIVVLGGKWANERKVEVQCRRLKVKENVAFDQLPEVLLKLSSQL